jgi:hypothetical protein
MSIDNCEFPLLGFLQKDFGQVFEPARQVFFVGSASIAVLKDREVCGRSIENKKC